jgi:hypothetical protein
MSLTALKNINVPKFSGKMYYIWRSKMEGTSPYIAPQHYTHNLRSLVVTPEHTRIQCHFHCMTSIYYAIRGT